MKPFLAIPDLEILSTYSLQPHEYIDEDRVAEVMDSLKTDGILKNPPVAMPFRPELSQYVILDGASRMKSFERLGFPHILVQTVQPGENIVHIETWNHVVLGRSPEDLFAAIEDSRVGKTVPVEEDIGAWQDGRRGKRTILIFPDRGCFAIQCDEDSLESRVECLNLLAKLYGQSARIERTSSADLERLKRIYPDLSCVVLLPKFTMGEVLKAADAGLLLPPGLTRFIVSPRALRVNYPIEWLQANRPLKEKRAQLQEWLKKNIAGRNIRFYEESTFLFDE
jgi:hypothetical protein